MFGHLNVPVQGSSSMADFVPCDHLLQRPIRPFALKGHGSIAHSASPLGLVTFRANCARYEKDFKDNKDNNRHLARKYARMFVLGHYLFLVAHSFPGASLSENCSLLGTDNVRGQIPEHIFAPNGYYCLYIFSWYSDIFFGTKQKKWREVGSWLGVALGLFFPLQSAHSFASSWSHDI